MGSEELKVVLGEIIETALEAEKRGVVIDWKSMTFKCYNLTSNFTANEAPVQEELLDAATPTES
jgi:hypothetical protein